MINRTMFELLQKPWATAVVENSYHQARVGYLHRAIQDDDHISYVIDTSQIWSETPQGRPYWAQISANL